MNLSKLQETHRRGKPGVLQSMGLQNGHALVTEQQHVFILGSAGSLAARWFSLVEGHSLVAVCRLLIALASPVTGRRRWSAGSALWGTGSVVLWHGESSRTRDQTHVPCFRR